MAPSVKGTFDRPVTASVVGGHQGRCALVTAVRARLALRVVVHDLTRRQPRPGRTG